MVLGLNFETECDRSVVSGLENRFERRYSRVPHSTLHRCALEGTCERGPWTPMTSTSQRTSMNLSLTGRRRNIKKEGGIEPDLWVRLYRVEF